MLELDLFFTTTGATEVFGANPPENIELFRLSGSSRNVFARGAFIGNGSLFVYSTPQESTVANEVVRIAIKLSGSGTESFTPAPHVGTGSIFERGSANTTRTVSYPVTELDPSGNEIPGTITVFEFKGSAVEKNTESYEGSGSLFTFISSTQSALVSQVSSGELFKFSGSATESTTPAPHIGSGSLFTFVSSTESVGSNPPENTQLFRFSGSGVEKNTESYFGSGSLFTFVSSTESVGSNPPENTQLFKFSGSGTESKTPAPHIGSGSLFTFISSTESKLTFESSFGLFKFSGSAVEKNTESYVGSGSLFGFSSATEAVSFVTSVSTIFKFSGSAAEKNTESYVGSGTVFGLSSASQAVLINYELTKVLFKLSSTTTHKVFYNAATNEIRIAINGQSKGRYIEYEPPQPTRIYII